jgi:hypothetical protein
MFLLPKFGSNLAGKPAFNTSFCRFCRITPLVFSIFSMAQEWRNPYTRDYCSWVTGPLPEATRALWLKVVRKGLELDIFHSLDGSNLLETGVGYLGAAESVMVGPMRGPGG